MHDIRAIRENPAAFDAALARRKSPFQVSEIASILHGKDAAHEFSLSSPAYLLSAFDIDVRASIEKLEEMRANRRVQADLAGAAKRNDNIDEFNRRRQIAEDLRKRIDGQQKLVDGAKARLQKALLRLPNLPLKDVPDGSDESDNVTLRTWGQPRRFDFQPLEHYEIAAAKASLDFQTAAKISGSRFVIMKGAIARVHRALSQFMLDTHVNEHKLIETWTPVLVSGKTISDAAIDKTPMGGTGQLPKFREDLYHCSSEAWREENFKSVVASFVKPEAIEAFRNGSIEKLEDLLAPAFSEAPTNEEFWLIPTSEVTLTNTVAGEILDESALPIRMTAHTQCFRSEAGSAGKDTSGMLRQHQFEKVEMVSITTPDTSLAEHERMTRCAEAILEKLGLPYRTVVLCTGDMGFGATKTHDLEVWLPGQNTYREISSVSVCGDFQARRMNARYRPAGGKPEFVHTLNGSGLAVGRCLNAVLENGQQADGSVDLPAVLHSYLGGKTRIAADGRLE